MTDKQWIDLQDVVKGEILSPLPVGFIIDSPWLPNWYGISILDYFSNDQLWLDANLKAINTFPEVMFLPGFWSEYGMCSEPSAFGAKSSFPENEFPHAFPNISSVDLRSYGSKEAHAHAVNNADAYRGVVAQDSPY